MVDFIDLEEIDTDDAEMHILAQSFSREVKVWFIYLRYTFVSNSQELIELFMAKWEGKKKPLHILAKYNALKINPNESVQDFIAGFNRIYDSIP